MEFTSIKQTRFNIAKTIITLISFTVFLTILALGSCAEESTAPPGGPQPEYMSFTLTNASGTTIYSTNELSRGSTYGLVITPASGTPISTADYTVTYTPASAITGIATNTNSVDFTVNNTTDTSVTITVTHRTISAISETITLTLTPQVDYMSFALTNLGGGPTVASTTPLSRRNNYRLTIMSGSGVVPATADYVVTYTPATAITGIATNTNSVDFTINNTTDTSVTVTVTHRTASAVSETITLTLTPQVDYMSFALTNRSGTAVATTDPLSRGNTYGLVITRASGTTTPTADYTITHTPSTAIIIETRLSNSVDFTVDNTPATSVTFTVTHRTNSAVSETITLNLESQVVAATFQQNIENATTVPNLIIANALTREVLSPLGSIRGGATLVKRYVTTNGGGSYNGSSWADAWAATNLRNGIDLISDATASRVYLIMVAGGTYTPGATRGDSFRMTNHVAIMGGFDPAGGWGRTGTTIFSGDIGAAGNNGDNSYRVFSHNSLTLNNAHLYGVTITGGNANGSNPQNFGGGMYNSGSSPVLTKVIFSGNTATSRGGGMYNRNSSSPVLTRVVFNENNADWGGGMYNTANSSPVLTEVVFRNNSAANGGGMYNRNSSPVLTTVVFSGNTARFDGGGMDNNVSSPVLIGAVFSGNTSGSVGGGMNNNSSSPVIIGAVFTNNRSGIGGAMLNDNGSAQAGPLIVNSIFSGNNATGNGPDIAMNLGSFFAGTENIRIAGSVLGINLAQPTNGIVGFNSGAAVNITYHSLANGAVRFGADATLTVNGMSFPYPTITGGSAVNLGLHVWRSGTTYYFSEDRGTWYTGFTSTGAGGLVTVDTPPANAEDLTATDIAGNARNGRPDAGVYEVQ